MRCAGNAAISGRLPVIYKKSRLHLFLTRRNQTKAVRTPRSQFATSSIPSSFSWNPREHHPQKVKTSRNAERCAFIEEISAAR
ncbi:hypothetical protein EJB05_29961, partial [Eragrostis curvula]